MKAKPVAMAIMFAKKKGKMHAEPKSKAAEMKEDVAEAKSLASKFKLKKKK